MSEDDDVLCWDSLFTEHSQQKVAFFVGFERRGHDNVVARCEFVASDHFPGVSER